MIIHLTVPPLPESITEATLLGWRKKVGDVVARDEILISLETDKIVLDVPAPESGVLTSILKQEGDNVTSATPLATMDTAMDLPLSTPETAVKFVAASENTSILMPAARKMVADYQLDPAQITGSGKDGRILKQDVQQAIAQSIAPSPAQLATTPVSTSFTHTPIASTTERMEKRVPMSRLRQRVAQRLLESQSTNAILTTFNEVNMQAVLDLREKYKETFAKEFNVKLSFMGFFVKAVVHALKKFPVINASIEENEMVYHSYFDIGVAVGSPHGLVVPIIRNADQLTLAQIEMQIADFARRAQDGKLAIEDITGGTYTISNGGTYGSMLSTPIINPPQSAILGMHAIQKRAVVENDEIVIRPMMYLAQSYDHRIIDGREAVSSLVAIKHAIEDPTRLLLEV